MHNLSPNLKRRRQLTVMNTKHSRTHSKSYCTLRLLSRTTSGQGSTRLVLSIVRVRTENDDSQLGLIRWIFNGRRGRKTKTPKRVTTAISSNRSKHGGLGSQVAMTNSQTRITARKGVNNTRSQLPKIPCSDPA